MSDIKPDKRMPPHIVEWIYLASTQGLHPNDWGKLEEWFIENKDWVFEDEWFMQFNNAESFGAYDPADAWDNHIHQQEVALEAYEEYLEELEEEDEPLSFEDWYEREMAIYDTPEYDAYLEEQYQQMQEDNEELARLMDDDEYTTLEGTLDSETFEAPVSCKICGKTFASFRGLNGHMNAHIPSHRKRAEECEHQFEMVEIPMQAGHKHEVGWANAVGMKSYHMVCTHCDYCMDCFDEHEFASEEKDIWWVTICATMTQDYLEDLQNGDESWNDVEWQYRQGFDNRGQVKRADMESPDNEERFITDITCEWCGEPYDGTEVLDAWEGQIVHRRCIESDEYQAESEKTPPCAICGDKLVIISEDAGECATCYTYWNIVELSDLWEEEVPGLLSHLKVLDSESEQFLECDGCGYTTPSFKVGDAYCYDCEVEVYAEDLYEHPDCELDILDEEGVQEQLEFWLYENHPDFCPAGGIVYEARGTSGWKVTCSKCGKQGHNKRSCRRGPKRYARKTMPVHEARQKNIKSLGLGVALGWVVGMIFGRNL